jgi:hypothetical protein
MWYDTMRLTKVDDRAKVSGPWRDDFPPDPFLGTCFQVPNKTGLDNAPSHNAISHLSIRKSRQSPL